MLSKHSTELQPQSFYPQVYDLYVVLSFCHVWLDTQAHVMSMAFNPRTWPSPQLLGNRKEYEQLSSVIK